MFYSAFQSNQQRLGSVAYYFLVNYDIEIQILYKFLRSELNEVARRMINIFFIHHMKTRIPFTVTYIQEV